jgi:hypothetical protein
MMKIRFFYEFYSKFLLFGMIIEDRELLLLESNETNDKKLRVV